MAASGGNERQVTGGIPTQCQEAINARRQVRFILPPSQLTVAVASDSDTAVSTNNQTRAPDTLLVHAGNPKSSTPAKGLTGALLRQFLALCGQQSVF